MTAEQKRLTIQRKRAACGELRVLAQEVGVPVPAQGGDLSKNAFSELHQSVKDTCRSPDQAVRDEKAQKTYEGQGNPESTMPQVLQLPALAINAAPSPPPESSLPAASEQPAASSGQESAEPRAKGIRLGSQSCLFTF